MQDDASSTVVYGSRVLDSENVPGSRLYALGSRVITEFFNVLYGQRITDINICYKLFPRRLLGEISLDEKGFAFDEEFSCQIVKCGYTIVEEPVSYTPRPIQEGKKLRWWHGFRSIYVIMRNKARPSVRQ